MTFYEMITAAVKEFEQRGYVSDQELAVWITRLRNAANDKLTPQSEVSEILARSLGAIYRKEVDAGGILRRHVGVSRVTLNKVRPQLHNELQRRITASANLIKLNREQAVEKTLSRFSGWATSIPAGGSKVVETKDVKEHIGKPLRQQQFEERRVAIDQGHKMVSALNDIVAVDGGAIAAIWHSPWRRPGYDYRVDHKERDEKCYLIRGSWAQAKGLVKAGDAGYTDQITQPAEEVYCSCHYQYVYNLRDLPANMLTEKGRKMLEAVKIK